MLPPFSFHITDRVLQSKLLWLPMQVILLVGSHGECWSFSFVFWPKRLFSRRKDHGSSFGSAHKFYSERPCLCRSLCTVHTYESSPVGLAISLPSIPGFPDCSATILPPEFKISLGNRKPPPFEVQFVTATSRQISVVMFYDLIIEYST